jgi:hypothetical protein
MAAPAGVRARGELEESAILSQQELLLPGEFIVLAAQRVLAQALPIGLIGSQAVEGVDAVGERRRAFMRTEIADQIGAATRYRLTPVACVVLELGFLRRIDVIANETGDHVCLRFGRLSMTR